MRIRSALHWIVRRLRAPRPKPLILMYHRIAEPPVDPWGLAVSPTRFEEQLRVLRRTRHPMPLADLVRGLAAGTLPANAVALTFDDGYADNLLAGKPRLAAADVPATVFIATGYIDQPGELWWDELASLVLVEHGPQTLDVMVGDRPMHFEFGAEAPASSDLGWRAWSNPLTHRQAAYVAIWQALRPLDRSDREDAMATIRSAIAVQGSGSTRVNRPMTSHEVRELAKDGLITIGAHTVTHPPLTGLEAGACRREIVESRTACEALIGASVPGFAYPHGDLDDRVRAEVQGAGFGYACSTRHAPVTMASDILALPRIHVHDWDGDVFDRAVRACTGN